MIPSGLLFVELQDVKLSVPVDSNLRDVSSLLTVHTEYPAPEVLDARHRLLLLHVDHPEDAVVRPAGHEVVPAEVLDTGEVGALSLWLNISYDVTTAVVQDLELLCCPPAGHGNLPALPVDINPLPGYEGTREPPDTVRSPGVPHLDIPVPAAREELKESIRIRINYKTNI